MIQLFFTKFLLTINEFIVLKLTDLVAAIFIFQFSRPWPIIVRKFAYVLMIFGPLIQTQTMQVSVDKIALVDGSIWVDLNAMTCSLVITKFTSVSIPFAPLKLTFTVKHSFLEISTIPAMIQICHYSYTAL